MLRKLHAFDVAAGHLARANGAKCDAFEGGYIDAGLCYPGVGWGGSGGGQQDCGEASKAHYGSLPIVVAGGQNANCAITRRVIWIHATIGRGTVSAVLSNLN